MPTRDAKDTSAYISDLDFPHFFSDWLKRRRKQLDLTQNELAESACCSVFALRKIEAGDRRPSKQLAAMLAKALEIPSEDHITFIKVARGELNVERLQSIPPVGQDNQLADASSSPKLSGLPLQIIPLIGRETEMAALAKLLNEPQCRLLTITGLGGIGKTRLAIELASRQRDTFPAGIYYVSLESINSPEFIIPTIAEVFDFTFSGAANQQEQLINHLATLTVAPMLLVLDNLEHLLIHPPQRGDKDETTLLLSTLLQKLPNLKILVTSRERTNLQEEWIFELHGLPVPTGNQTNRLEEFSAVVLFLQRARQLKADFELLPADRPSLARICQLVEGTPLAIELAAAWVGMLSMEEIAQEITTNLDFLTNPMRNIPERHRSLKAVFAHSWKLLSIEERAVLSQLAVFRGGFQRQAAEQVAGASLPILLSLQSKSLLMHLDNNRYDLHALIRQCALERLQGNGKFEQACNHHLAYFISLALEAQQGLRSAQLAEWLDRIEQEHNNIRAALEWALNPLAPTERVEEGINLLTLIDRFWAARGYIREGITWLERGLQVCSTHCLARAKALRIAGWLYNHLEDSQMAVRFLEESLSIARQLNDETWQANALDTLGDIGWRFGDFDHAKVYYAESLELYRRGGDEQKIGLSLASAGRLHVDAGYFQEADALLTEALSLLENVSDLRGCAWCFNALGRLALFQGQLSLAESQFCHALQLNYELGYMVDIADGLHSLSIVKAISGEESSATLLRSAATTLQKRIGYTYPENDPIFQRAPLAWLQSASSAKEWKEGEKQSLDWIVAHVLGQDAESFPPEAI